MELGTGAKRQGSMGIPPEMIENQKRFEQKKASEKKPGVADDTPPPPDQPAQDIDSGFAPDDAQENIAAATNPMKVLKDLGLNFNEDDLQNLLFKGFYEASVEVVKGRFKAKIRTLTVQEYDEVDELLGEDIKSKEMTREGFEARRSMWIISYATTELAGKPIVKQVKNKDGTLDSKGTAKEKRKVLGALSSMVVNRMIQVHGTITTAINLIGQDPEILKNS